MAKQSKKEAERAKAEKHKASLAAIKANRRAGTSLERKAPALKEKPIILIYCEGQNTEPSYFNKFRIPSITIKAFGEGRNTLSLVERASTIFNKAKDGGKPFEEVWCVFDADPKGDNPQQLKNFNDAVQLSYKLGFGTAYSNQAFEYWLILHFEDHQGGSMSRTDYDPKLNKYLSPYKLSYEGNDSKIISQEFFDLLFEVIDNTDDKLVTRTDIAIKRAKRIYDFHEDHANPGDKESSTTVFQLVERLLAIQNENHPEQAELLD